MSQCLSQSFLSRSYWQLKRIKAVIGSGQSLSHRLNFFFSFSILFFLLEVFLETFLISFEPPSSIISFCFPVSLIVCLHFLMASLYLFLSISPSFPFPIQFCFIFQHLDNSPSPTDFFNLLCISNLYWNCCWVSRAELILKLISSPSPTFLLQAPNSWLPTSSDYFTQYTNNSSCLALMACISDVEQIF